MSIALERWRAAGKTVSVDGVPVFVRDEGEGEGEGASEGASEGAGNAADRTVLLLHGYPTGSYDWHAVWPRLQPGRRLIAPDFPGLGFSGKPEDDPSGRYTLARHAQTLDALLPALGVTAVHIVAHDLGVRVAQALLVRREDGWPGARVQSLVLLNGALCPEAYRPRPVQRLLATPLGPWLGPRLPRRRVQRTLAGLFGPHTPPSAALLDDFWTLIDAGGGRRVVHAVGRFWQTPPALRDRLVGALLRTHAPLRLINGSLDPNSGEAMVRRWETLQPGADVVRLPQVGHWPQIEAPAATAEAILSFWQRGAPAVGSDPFSPRGTPPGSG